MPISISHLPGHLRWLSMHDERWHEVWVSDQVYLDCRLYHPLPQVHLCKKKIRPRQLHIEEIFLRVKCSQLFPGSLECALASWSEMVGNKTTWLLSRMDIPHSGRCPAAQNVQQNVNRSNSYIIPAPPRLRRTCC